MQILRLVCPDHALDPAIPPIRNGECAKTGDPAGPSAVETFRAGATKPVGTAFFRVHRNNQPLVLHRRPTYSRLSVCSFDFNVSYARYAGEKANSSENRVVTVPGSSNIIIPAGPRGPIKLTMPRKRRHEKEFTLRESTSNLSAVE